MSKQQDITRWNRAGLRRFRYLDANAATYLEELRLRLAERFPDWARVARVVPGDESPAARNERLLAQYREGRAPEPDWGWEIARALARACHVLGEHVDAYANEGFLGTATQWESVRRLVAMLDHSPGPPASASTVLALDAKERGTLRRGFAVKHNPPTGGASITFETLEDLEVDPALNTLRPRGFDRSMEGIQGAKVTLEGRVSGLVIGEPLVLEREDDGRIEAFHIANVIESDESTQVTVTPAIPPDTFRKGSTRIHVDPRDRIAPLGPIEPQPNLGNEIRLVSPPTTLAKGQVVTLWDGIRRVYTNIIGIDGNRVTLATAAGKLAVAAATLSQPVPLAVVSVAGRTDGLYVDGDLRRLQGEVIVHPRDDLPAPNLFMYRVAAAEFFTSGPAVNRTRLLVTPLAPSEPGLGSSSPIASLPNPLTLLVPPIGPGTYALDAFLEQASDGSPPLKLSTETPKSTSGGDIAVLAVDGDIAWARLALVAVDLDARSATMQPEGKWQFRDKPTFWRRGTIVFGHFRERARVIGWNENRTPIDGLVVPLDAPAALTAGRRVVVEKRGDPSFTLLTAVDGVAAGGSAIALRSPLPAGRGLTLGNLVISANVVRAGHGERKPDKVLGSGDAARSGQSFVLAEPRVSFVADPTRAQGVRADVEVVTGPLTWRQVETLRGREPTEAAYTVRLTEEGHLVFQFGDGVTGRRLPTGTNNVRVRYRVGVGLAGNLPPRSLVKPARTDPLIAAVRHPLPAAGGNDIEPIESLRRTAPQTVLTLGRAVSLGDFEALAGANSSVSQARASFGEQAVGRAQSIDVIVVPAAGGALDPELARTIADFLTLHALPGVEVHVRGHESQLVTLDVSIEVDPAAYEPDDVLRRTRAALLDALSLRRRRLGQPLYLSEVYQVVESIEGVESSLCILDSQPGVSVAAPRSRAHIVHLDPSGATLTLRHQVYSL